MTSKQQTTRKTVSRKLDSRRDFLTKASYSAPVLLSLPAIPSFAQSGSGAGGGSNGGGGIDPTDCIAQYDEFLMDRGFPGFEDLITQIRSQADGITPEQRAVLREMEFAFNDSAFCEFS